MTHHRRSEYPKRDGADRTLTPFTAEPEQLEDRFVAAFRDLSESQQDVVVSLIEGVVSGDVPPLDDSPDRIALARFEAEAAAMSAQECHQALHDLEYRVSAEPGWQDAPGDDAFMVSHTWTLKGLRAAVAEERFLAAVRFGEQA